MTMTMMMNDETNDHENEHDDHEHEDEHHEFDDHDVSKDLMTSFDEPPIWKLAAHPPGRRVFSFTMNMWKMWQSPQ